jgi:hypothetical protein
MYVRVNAKATGNDALLTAVHDLERLGVQVVTANVASRGVATLLLGANGIGPKEIARLDVRARNLDCLRLAMRELAMKNIGVGSFAWRLKQVRKSVLLLRALLMLRHSLKHPNRSGIFAHF